MFENTYNTIKSLSDSSNTSGKNVTYFDGSKSTSPKGQFISKGLFDVIVWTKKPTKFFIRISALAS